jgi:hypothetical protein
MRPASTIALVLAAAIAAASPAAAIAAASPAPALAAAASPTPELAAPRRDVMRTHSIICKGLGWLSGLAGTACKVVSHPKTVVTVGKKLLGGDPGGALKAVLGSGTKTAGAAVGLAAVVAWVTGGARAALEKTAKLIDESARPNLQSTWFSSAYWRVAAVSALMTLPFLFAAAIQALLRSDPSLLARAAFGYLPLGMLAVGVAAPITMLLLAASDEMSSIVASASGNAGGTFLGHVSTLAVASNPFVAFFVALLTVSGAVTLWLELLVREAAVYVIVLMLPLFFAALVWPARRIWAVRAVELLIALVLSKFAIVAVLELGGAALEHAAALSITSLLAGLTLVLLAAFSPWALLRLLPLHELASAAAAGMRHMPMQRLATATNDGHALGDASIDFVGALPAHLQAMARAARNEVPAEQPAPALAPAPSPSEGGAAPSRAARAEAAAAEAASAVAASGGAVVGEPGSPSPPPAASGSSDQEGHRPRTHFAAPGLETLPEQLHREGEPQPLDALDPDRPFFAPGSSSDAPVDLAAPSLPDPEPLPPTIPAEEDAR